MIYNKHGTTRIRQWITSPTLFVYIILGDVIAINNYMYIWSNGWLLICPLFVCLFACLCLLAYLLECLLTCLFVCLFVCLFAQEGLITKLASLFWVFKILVTLRRSKFKLALHPPCPSIHYSVMLLHKHTCLQITQNTNCSAIFTYKTLFGCFWSWCSKLLWQ